MPDYTPEATLDPDLVKDVQQVNATGSDAAARLRQLAQAGRLSVTSDPDEPKRISYMSPTHPNTRFLAVKGKTVSAPYNPNSLGLQPVVRRDGDVWVEFVEGVCTTDDQQSLDWLEAHSGWPELHGAYHKACGDDPNSCETPIGLCREFGEGMDVWAELKAGQEATASRPATISKDIDIDAFMRGDFRQGNKSMRSGLGRAMADAAQNNQNAADERANGQR